MKKRTILSIIFLLVIPMMLVSQEYIADYRVSKESVLRQIPAEYINAAKNNLHIMYCGTSHSSQTVDGMRGLMEYKTGDNTLFAVTFNGTPVAGALDIHYRPPGPFSASDLSHDTVDGAGKTEYFYRTVEYLDNPNYADVNVVMWSWCSIEGHDVQIYLDNFQELINMYRAGGSKGRTAANEVKFVFMTGYATGDDGDTAEPPYIRSPYQNHKRIVDFCRANGYFCLDYWSQDTYEYETDAYNPYEDGNNNAQHLAYVNSHTLGEDWFYSRIYYSGEIHLPAHANQHLTGNRRAYAAWWIWARLAGWSGNSTSGKADFDGNGKPDILWRYYGPNNPGQNVVWCMNGANCTAIEPLRQITDVNWKFVGTGDFNSDGKTDILLRYYGAAKQGKNLVWYMDGTTRIGYAWLDDMTDLDWKIESTGDFNDDGKIDILWRYYGPNNPGQNVVWYMDGVTRTAVAPLKQVTDLNWKFEGTGDFNSDGKVDILLRYYGVDKQGWNLVWYMDGTTRIGYEWLKEVTDLNWRIEGTGDFNSDGKVDILLRYYGAAKQGKNLVWYMNGTTRIGYEWLDDMTGLDWIIENN